MFDCFSTLATAGVAKTLRTIRFRQLAGHGVDAANASRLPSIAGQQAQ